MLFLVSSAFTSAMCVHDHQELVSDAHTTEDQTAWGAPIPAQVIAHTNPYWSYQTAPGRRGGTLPADAVAFTAGWPGTNRLAPLPVTLRMPS